MHRILPLLLTYGSSSISEPKHLHHLTSQRPLDKAQADRKDILKGSAHAVMWILTATWGL